MLDNNDRRTLVDGPLEVYLDERFARVNGTPVVLTDCEFKVLLVLARQAGRVVRRDQLYRDVWGGELRARDRSVDVYVFKLRGKLESALPGWRFIHTHTRWGYRLKPEWGGQTSSQSAGSRRSTGVSRRPGAITSRRAHPLPVNHGQGSHR